MVRISLSPPLSEALCAWRGEPDRDADKLTGLYVGHFTRMRMV